MGSKNSENGKYMQIFNCNNIRYHINGFSLNIQQNSANAKTVIWKSDNTSHSAQQITKKNKQQRCMYWKGNWNLSSKRHIQVRRNVKCTGWQYMTRWDPAFILHGDYSARAGFSKGKHGKNCTRKIWPTHTPQIPARVQPLTQGGSREHSHLSATAEKRDRTAGQCAQSASIQIQS